LELAGLIAAAGLLDVAAGDTDHRRYAPVGE
jgi:hypothetical protein